MLYLYTLSPLEFILPLCCTPSRKRRPDMITTGKMFTIVATIVAKSTKTVAKETQLLPQLAQLQPQMTQLFLRNLLSF